MSRIGLRKLNIPDGVEVRIERGKSSFKGAMVYVKGPKGELSLNMRPQISIEEKDGVITLTRKKNDPSIRALHGLYNSLVNNMIVGVTKGFSKKLLLKGIGYRINPKGQGLEILLGYSHPIVIDPIEGITFEVGDNNTSLTVTGIDKTLVGKIAAEIRSHRPVEPYKGKGFRYHDEEAKRKPGKAAVATSVS